MRAAGGYLIQLMPGATDDMIDKIEAGIEKAGAVTKLLDSGMDGKGLLETVLGAFELEILEQTPVELLLQPRARDQDPDQPRQKRAAGHCRRGKAHRH